MPAPLLGAWASINVLRNGRMPSSYVLDGVERLDACISLYQWFANCDTSSDVLQGPSNHSLQVFKVCLNSYFFKCN